MWCVRRWWVVRPRFEVSDKGREGFLAVSDVDVAGVEDDECVGEEVAGFIGGYCVGER